MTSLPSLGFEFTSERTSDGIQMRCTACPHADLAAALESAGHEDARLWMYEIVCSTDFHTVGAFDPPIRFERRHTLIQGDAFCDHRYRVGESD